LISALTKLFKDLDKFLAKRFRAWHRFGAAGSGHFDGGPLGIV
jgi:hypothetical protein